MFIPVYLLCVALLFLYAFSDDITLRLTQKKIRRKARNAEMKRRRMARKAQNKKGSDVQ